VFVCFYLRIYLVEGISFQIISKQMIGHANPPSKGKFCGKCPVQISVI